MDEKWKALDEIYKISTLLHRPDLNISANFRQFVWRFQCEKCKNIFSNFVAISLIFMKIARIISDFVENAEGLQGYRFKNQSENENNSSARKERIFFKCNRGAVASLIMRREPVRS